MRHGRSSNPQDLLVGCDPEQVEAITTNARPLCVIAGAGSGKTRVLTRRIAWRVLDGSAVASHVLTLTFTRKAAAELRGRLSQLGLPETVTAGTFHAIALSELRRLAAERGHLPPVVLSSKARLVHAVLSDRPLGARSSARRSAGAKRPPVHEVAAEIEWSKARLVSPVDYQRAAASAGRRTTLRPAEIAEVYEAYERERRKRGLLDFEDLLTVCASEVASDAEFAASARWRFRHIFVDEYQDVNAAQLRLLKAWCGDNDDLCVVGDPQQAIYGWNGSDPLAISSFRDVFPGGHVVGLRTNYRSTGEVLSVAAAVLAAEDVPPAGGPSPEGPIPTVNCYGSDAEEAAAVAEQARLAHRPGRRWSQIGVLARTNSQLEPLAQAFEARRIPYRIVGEGDFLRRPHVKAAIGDLQRARDASALQAMARDLSTAWAEPGQSEVDEELGTSPDHNASPEAEDLAELAQMVEEYLSADLAASGQGFRAFLEASARSLEAARSSDAVELMTFHRAKGLEWAVVFVTGLEDGFVPIAHAHDELALAEERRLLYVACTRAEEELHCTWAKERRFSAERPSKRAPSPYLASIESAARRLDALAQRSASSARVALAESRRILADPRGR